MIKIVKQCSLIGLGCAEVFAKIGEITHVIEQKHWIMGIDWYLDYRFICRQSFKQPEPLNPGGMIHLMVLSKDSKKVVSELEKRNIKSFYCETKDEVMDKVFSLLTPKASIGIAGSMTLKEINFS